MAEDLGERPRRFWPAWWLWLLPIIGLLLVVWAPPGVASRGPGSKADPFADRMMALAMAGVLLFVFLRLATCFAVTRDGVERRRLFLFVRIFPWEDIARVRGRQIRVRDALGINDRTESGVTTIVYDHRGEVLFRVGPWIEGRRRLARLIREHTK